MGDFAKTLLFLALGLTIAYCGAALIWNTNDLWFRPKTIYSAPTSPQTAAEPAR